MAGGSPVDERLGSGRAPTPPGRTPGAAPSEASADCPRGAPAEGGAPRRWRGWLIVTLGVLITRTGVWAAGNGFVMDQLYPRSGWHLADPAYLRQNPFGPLWDLHIQPPLFNVMVGVVLRWSPLPDAVSFEILFAAGAVAGAVALYEILVGCGCRWWVAAFTTVLVFSDPMLIFYELGLFHEPVVTPLLLLTIWACLAYARTPTLGRLGLFVGSGAVLVLTRAMFTPLWFLAMGLVIVIRPPPVDWRRTALVAAIPLLLVVGIMAKNQVRFGAFTLSSWFGMNFERAAIDSQNQEYTRQAVDEGRVSGMAAQRPFGDYKLYMPFVAPCEQRWGTPVLDRPTKPDGEVNYNYGCFVHVYAQAQRDSVAAIRSDPATYARTVRTSTLLYLTDAPYEQPSGPVADGLRRLHDVLGLEVRTSSAVYPNGYGDRGPRVQLTVVVALLGLIALGLWALVAAARGRRTPNVAVATFVGVTILYVTGVSVLFDAFENARFRAPLDPVLFGAVVGGTAEIALRWRARRRTPGETDRRARTGETDRPLSSTDTLSATNGTADTGAERSPAT
jgi:hypothetical protein